MHSACTYLDRTCLAQGIALIQSMLRHLTPVTITVACLDAEATSALTAISDPRVRCMPLTELLSKNPEVSNLRNRSPEECLWTLIPGFVASCLLTIPENQTLVFLDPRAYLFSDLTPLEAELGSKSILIHEHHFFSRFRDYERKYGRFTSCFLLCRNDRNALTILSEWKTQCLAQCSANPTDGLFGNQGYLSNWPSKYPWVTVSTLPGAGLAYWNYESFEITTSPEGKPFVNGNPLHFFHFHGFSLLSEHHAAPASTVAFYLTEPLLKSVCLPYLETLRQSPSILRAKNLGNLPVFSNPSDVGATCAILVHQALLPSVDKAPGSSRQNRLELTQEWTCFEGRQIVQPLPPLPSRCRIETRSSRELTTEDTLPILQEAKTLIDRNLFADALELLLNLEHLPRVQNYLSTRAICHFRLGEVQKACACLREELSLFPSFEVPRKLYTEFSASQNHDGGACTPLYQPRARPTTRNTTSPKITLVTPCFNGAQYLARCIESILSQGYANLEYMILDGGSTDGSVEIIKRYEKHLTFWRSTPDKGQYHAINEGLQRGTGEIMGWLNSDDMLHPGCLQTLVEVFSVRPEVEFITGRRVGFQADDTPVSFSFECQQWSRNLFLDPTLLERPKLTIMQEGTFWRKSLWDRAGGSLDLSLSLAGDFELWARFLRHTLLHTVDARLGGFRDHGATQRSKTLEKEYWAEAERVLARERLLPSSDQTRDAIVPALITVPVKPAPEGRVVRHRRLVIHNPAYPNTTIPSLPKLSIVTPSFNQADYLEECIDSVLSQRGANFEYIIMDGGSTDGSVEIIKKYEKYLTYWRSAPDAGPYSAINEGFQMATGQICAWLNSDDRYHPDAFRIAQSSFAQYPKVEWVTGRPNAISTEGDPLWCFFYDPQYSQSTYIAEKFGMPWIQQESVFFRRSLWDRSGGQLNTTWKLAADLELWTRFFRTAYLYNIPALLGSFRIQPAQRSSVYSRNYYHEAYKILAQETDTLIRAGASPKGTPRDHLLSLKFLDDNIPKGTDSNSGPSPLVASIDRTVLEAQPSTEPVFGKLRGGLLTTTGKYTH